MTRGALVRAVCKKTGMSGLLREITRLKRSPVKKLVGKRMREFKHANVFNELCFCLLTANFNAERAIAIQNEIGSGFSSLSRAKLAAKLKQLGYRYPNTRAGYIVEARKHDLVLDRDWLVKNVKGLGMKEASHFLRNTGSTDYAIIDFHIIDLLVRYCLIRRPKNLSKQEYLRIEAKLKKLAGAARLSLAELDLYLWYLETGKVLK